MFFSVKTTIRIANKVYSPCICYALPNFLEFTVRELEKKGQAEIHDRPVFFQNGKKIERKAKAPKQVAKETLITETDTSVAEASAAPAVKNLAEKKKVAKKSKEVKDF